MVPVDAATYTSGVTPAALYRSTERSRVPDGPGSFSRKDQLSIEPAMKFSTDACASWSEYCTGGDFMK
jgi:hypothetical protein